MMIEVERYRKRIDEILVKGKGYRAAGFSAGKLAEELGVSIYKLSRIMGEAYGMTYTEKVHSCRVQEAMRLLKNQRWEDYTVDDIGAMVGFGNRQSFFVAFKKMTGTTPERFRLS